MATTNSYEINVDMKNNGPKVAMTFPRDRVFKYYTLEMGQSPYLAQWIHVEDCEKLKTDKILWLFSKCDATYTNEDNTYWDLYLPEGTEVVVVDLK